MLPETLPTWAIFITAPLSAIMLLAAFIACGSAIDPGFGYGIRQGSFIAVNSCAIVLTSAVWFIHCRVFMKGIRANKNRRTKTS